LTSLLVLLKLVNQSKGVNLLWVVAEDADGADVVTRQGLLDAAEGVLALLGGDIIRTIVATEAIAVFLPHPKLSRTLYLRRY